MTKEMYLSLSRDERRYLCNWLNRYAEFRGSSERYHEGVLPFVSRQDVVYAVWWAARYNISNLDHGLLRRLDMGVGDGG